MVVVTSAAAALTSWTEFADIGRKTERYTRAVRSLKALLSWWDSLTEARHCRHLNLGTLSLRDRDANATHYFVALIHIHSQCLFGLEGQCISSVHLCSVSAGGESVEDNHRQSDPKRRVDHRGGAALVDLDHEAARHG